MQLTDASSPDGADASGTKVDASGATGIEIVNASYSKGSSAFSGYPIDFILRNHTSQAIQIIDKIELQFAGDPLPSVFVINFAAAGFSPGTCDAWRIAAGASSPLIELSLSVSTNTSSGFVWSIDVPCSVTQGTVLKNVSAAVNSNPAATFTLRLRGILADGTSFMSEGAGVLRN